MVTLDLVLKRMLHECTIIHVLREKLDKMPATRNCTVNVTGSTKDLDIVLERDDGLTLDVRTFLPPLYTWKEGDAFTCHSIKQEITIIPEEKDREHFLLSVFHEIGHAKNCSLLPHAGNYSPLSHKELCSIKYFIPRHCAKSFNKMAAYFLIPDATYAEHLLIVNFLGKNYHDPPWYVKKEEDAGAKDEREAWATGIRLLSSLQHQGWNIFNSQFARMYAASCLTTYDTEANNRVLLSHATSRRPLCKNILPEEPFTSSYLTKAQRERKIAYEKCMV